MATANGARVYYSLNSGGAYTEVPVPCTSIDPPQGTTNDVNRGHLNATLNLHTTSPGHRTTGEATFHFEWNSRLGNSAGKGMDFLQLVDGWWKNQTEGLYFKIEWPKPSGATNPPTSVLIGYVNKQPFPTVPETDRMMLDLTVKLTDEVTNTDHS